jgi:hypothetical protein
MRTGPAFPLVVLLGWLFVAGGSAAAQTGELVDRSELKVCADPNNLPYSDEKREGFEIRAQYAARASLRSGDGDGRR